MAWIPVRTMPRFFSIWVSIFHFSYRLDESSSTTLSEDYRPSTRRTTKPRYYFQPNAGADQSVIEARFKDNQGPLPGQLLPMAIPLGKPRMDPALRLPLYIDEGELMTSCKILPNPPKVITKYWPRARGRKNIFLSGTIDQNQKYSANSCSFWQ